MTIFIQCTLKKERIGGRKTEKKGWKEEGKKRRGRRKGWGKEGRKAGRWRCKSEKLLIDSPHSF